MKMKKINNLNAVKTFLLLTGVAATFSVGCNDDKKKDDPIPDTVKPQIVVLRPSNDGKFPSESDMQIEVRFTDDRALSQAKFEIHLNDGHSHKATPIDTQFVVALSGKEHTITRSIKLSPDKAAGPYHFIVECLDESGNRAEPVEVDIEVTSPLQPSISAVKMNDAEVTDHDEVHIHFDGKDRLENRLTGNIVAQGGGILESVSIKIYEDLKGHSHKTSGFSFERSIPANNLTAIAINENITFPADKFESGEQDYVLLIAAKDRSGHLKIFKGKLHVKK